MLLCSFHQYTRHCYRIETIVDSCTLMYYSLKLGGGGGDAPPMLKLGPAPLWSPPASPHTTQVSFITSDFNKISHS